MNVEVTFFVDEDIQEKFFAVSKLADCSPDAVIEKAMEDFIGKTIRQQAAEYKNQRSSSHGALGHVGDPEYYGKANRGIPRWAFKPHQYNHRLIRAFLFLEYYEDQVTLESLRELCSTPEYETFFVQDVRSTYNSMKADGPNTNGKVFEDDGSNVWIWGEVEATLREYEDYFFQPDVEDEDEDE